MKLFDVYSIQDIDIARAAGSYVWDTQDQRYLDMYGGHAVISIGHSHPHYVQRLSEQLSRIGFYSNSVRIAQQQQLAEKLGALSGYDNYQLFLCNSGAEANENAFKVASFYTGRKKIIAFTGAFHGRTSLAVATTDNARIVAPVNETENVVRIPFNDIAALTTAMDNTVAAVIIEGIQGVAGIYEPVTQFWQTLSTLCKQYGALLIADEVQSGYGRTGLFFAHQHHGVVPDIITVAKGMGNGFPVAGVLLAGYIPSAKEMLGTTFGGNYLACAAANAVLEVIEKEQLIANAAEMGSYLTRQLSQSVTDVAIRGRGLMLGLEANFPAQQVRARLLANHKIFTGAASNKNTVRVLPSLGLSLSEADSFIQAFTEVITSQSL